MAKKQKNDRLCLICGRKFRLKRKRGRPRKYCSNECYKIAHRRKADKRVNLGTPSTLNLSPKSVKYQLYLIENNIDVGRRRFSFDECEKDFVLNRMVYDEDGSISYLS